MKTSMTSSRGILGIILAISILFSISACKNQKTSESGTNAEEGTEIIEGKDAVIKEISDYPLPTSFEVTTMLIEAGASYILNLCNHVDRFFRDANP